jgi:chorismate mutase/prephenate dehydratase
MSDEIARRRAEIAEQDRAILDAMNARLRLVAELKTYKERAGIDFVDADQEERLLRALANANRGPLSARGLQQLFREILALTKRELPDT